MFGFFVSSVEKGKFLFPQDTHDVEKPSIGWRGVLATNM